MFQRRQSEEDRRTRQRSDVREHDRRGKKFDRRTSLIERRQRYMDRRRTYDEFWMGARDRRIRVMDRRRKDKI